MKKNEKTKFIVLTLIILVVVFAGYFIYNNIGPGKVYFFVSDSEIVSPTDAENSDSIKQNSKLYFYISYKKKTLDASVCVIQIDYEDNGEFKFYKKIMYEIDKDFPKLSCYIPPEYFNKREGKYKIMGYLDGRLVSSRVVNVSK